MTDKEQFVAHALSGLCANPDLISLRDLNDLNALEQVAKVVAEAAFLIGSRTQQQVGGIGL